MCVPELPPSFISTIARCKPRAVIHLEPCLEHADVGSLLGSMRRRYIEMNDYNRNLLGLLHAASEDGSVEIEEESPAVFGMHALLAVSLIRWKSV
jgi:hypothetical protein